MVSRKIQLNKFPTPQTLNRAEYIESDEVDSAITQINHVMKRSNWPLTSSIIMEELDLSDSSIERIFILLQESGWRWTRDVKNKRWIFSVLGPEDG